jgi:hypothetical protein
LITLLLASASLISGPAAAEQRASSFDFAETKIGGFGVKATTEIEWTTVDPYIGEIRCEGSNEEVRFVVNGRGAISWLNFTFDGPPDDTGNRAQLTYLGDVIWLYLDGEKIEYHNIGTPTNRFPNYAYPPEEDREILLLWTGYRALRTSKDAPLVDMAMFYQDIVDARKIEWGFKSRDWKDIDKSNPNNALPTGWEKRRYHINTKGLRGAVHWCAVQVSSSAATTLPDGIMRRQN